MCHDSIPYLSPELCLYYKSTDVGREGYQQDYDLATQKMDDVQKTWLVRSLRALYPGGHRWLP